MNQKLSDWASIAEIVSAAAIVVSLIFDRMAVTTESYTIQALQPETAAAGIGTSQ